MLETLETHGLAKDTLVFFTSDNGGVLHPEVLAAGHRSNGPLLGQKTDAWEGGHRVPFVGRWPGRIPAAARCERLFGLSDLMATIAAAANVPLPAGSAPDSVNQLPLLIDPTRAAATRTDLLVQGLGGYALRRGDWLYLPKPGSCGMTVEVGTSVTWGLPYSSLGFETSDVDAQGKIKPDAPPAQLYDLRQDLAQTVNRFRDEPEIAQRLAARLEELLPKPTESAVK